MAESESSISTDEVKKVDSPHGVKKPKKRSIVERELETNMTSRVTSPIAGEGMSTSRYGRARRLKTDDFEKKPIIDIKSPTSENTPNKSPTAYKMHAVNSPYKVKTPKHSVESNINNQIDTIYQENISLSRFNDHSPSPAKKSPKVYMRKDLIQTKDDDDDIILIKNLFSPIKHTLKSSKNINNKSTEKCNRKEIDSTENHDKKEIGSMENHNLQQKIDSTENYDIKEEIDSTEKYNNNENNIDNTSVVKTLDFDYCKRRKKGNKPTISKTELFEIEAKCSYQVGDLAWARVGTFPFWPCIVTRDPYSDMFVKRKLFGRVEHNIVHVTFFADNGRRSWIVDNMLRPYSGRAEFESTRDKFTAEDKKKDPRLYAAFFISEKKQPMWNTSVDEAETIMKEPKRFRIDILYDMIHKARASKKQTRSGKITRTNSDVSLSESLYDSLFSEDDSKTEEGRLRSRTRNPKSFDVSDVVTACLDNMAAKTGNSKIQRQSHMDRWLQKAKSKTPEKNQGKLVVKTERKSARLRTSKSSKKAANKSNSISNTDESNVSDLDVKSSVGKDSSAEENMSVCDSKHSKGLKTPILLADDVEKPPTEQSTDVVIKQELIDQENDKNGDIKLEEHDKVRINLVENEINAYSNETVNEQNVTSESSKNINVVEESKSESNNQQFGVKVDSTNETSESDNEDKIDTTKGTSNCEAMDVDDNSVSESNVKVSTVVENVTSKMAGDEKLFESNVDSNIKADYSKKIETAANNEINSLTDSLGAVQESKMCEMMEIDDKIIPETKPAGDSATKLDTDSNENKTIFLDEAPTRAEDNCEINQTSNFLDDDYKHLRDENLSSNNSFKKSTALKRLNVEAEAPKNKDESLKSSIQNTNISSNEIAAEEVKEDGILNQIDDVLNESGNSESILQSNDIDFDEKDTLNDAIVKKDGEPSISNVTECHGIDCEAEDGTKQLCDNKKSNKTELCSVHNVDIDVEKARISGSSTPKHGENMGPEEKLSEINNEPDIDDYYEIEDSDDEPSPEYEPLGEEITEDFRKHMQTIEQCVTDKKDEAQIAKICDQITKTVKQEILESISPTKVQTEHVKTLEKSPITEVKVKSLQEKPAEKVSSETQLVNNISPKTTEKQKSNVHNISKPSLPDKSIEDMSNEFTSERIPITNSNAEHLKLNVIPHRTRSKKINMNYNQNTKLEKNDKVPMKENKIVENGDIDHENALKNHLVLEKSAVSELDLLSNGLIERIYSKMLANEPKVVITPLKNVNLETPKTDKNKRPEIKLKLSLKKNRLYEIDSSDLDTSIEEPTIKAESKIVPIENGIEATIPISKQNGHSSNNTSKFAEDDDFDVDAASISSNDSHVSSVNTSILTPRRSSRCRTKFANGGGYAEFLHYFELRQDYLLDEYPGLDEDEIETYLQKTWEYEESLKCDVKKNDDIHHSNLVKGLKQETPKKETNNKKSKKAKPKNCIDNYFPDRRDKKKVEVKLEPIIKSEETENHVTDIQPSVSKSTDSIDKNLKETISETKTTPNSHKANTVNEIVEITPLKPIVTIDLTEDKQVDLEFDNKIKVEIDATSSKDVSTPKSSKKKRHSNSEISKPIKNATEIQKALVKSEDMDTESIDSDSEIPLRQLRSKVLKEKLKAAKETSAVAVKEEPDAMSVHSDDEPLNKNTKKKNDKTTENSYENPEFVKFLELRQDALIDENPQLTRKEIVDYLYKTWLYEESSKSDIKKSDEIEQSNLVKGLNQDIAPKKAKRKQKLDKTTNKVDEELTSNREKPKRKTVQPFYNEELYSDIEEEIELFEIFRKKPTATKKETKQTENVVKGEKCDEIMEIEDDTNQITVDDKVTNDLVKQDVELIDKAAVLDSWESYFADLLKPKPNVFKGLVREKVCEICEKTSNLYKCKGCNGMFHPGCLKKVEEVIEINTPNRGRKKKKKLGRKHKNLEDSESQGDEKPQDISEERNISVEEIITDTCTFDAETLEAQISEKMKEMLNPDDVHYDSYSSDDGIDWTDTVAGKCEIVDIKLKLKTPIVDYTNFRCNNCEQFDTPVCFVCKLAVSKNDVKMRQKCHIAQCHKYYHLECLDHWPQTQFLSGEPSRNNKKINEFFEALSCPRHVCHTCVSDDPRGCRTRFSGDKLARCVRCPATYHSFTKCLPAGSQILTGSQIICPRHYQQVVRPGKVPCHVNTGWCFICALGGSLICCEYCPTSFHAECLNIKPPEGNYMCEDCETGRLPLYGEMVWVKLGHYRWWPGIILHPSEISDNLMSVKHTLGEFVVRFFGQYDHYWVNRGRVFPYQEGDSGRISNQKTKIDAAFTTAMEHAQRAFEILKNANPNEEESLDIASSLLPPHYVKLKCNKPCGSLISRREDPALSLTQCECDPEENDPCGPYSHCLNRMLLTECGPTCRAGDRCNNRAFEKRLYPKMVPYRTPHRGWGLKTLQDIKAGQFVIEYVGELIDEEEFRRRMRRKHEIRDENYYFLTLDKERMIDAGPKGNLARFMNHCCEPNCETQKWTVLGDIRVGLFALYDIPANSEVTFNYNLECAGIDKKRCMCGAARCSGYIGAKPKQDENQSKKGKTKLTNHSNKDGTPPTKRTYNKKRKIEDTTKIKPKRPLGRPPKPKELTEIEKDLLIIKNATSDNSTSSKNETNTLLNSDDLSSSENSTTNSESVKKSATNNTPSNENLSKNTTKDLNNKVTTNNNTTNSKNSIKITTKAVLSSEKATENLTNSKNGTNNNIFSSKTLTIKLISSKNSVKNNLNSEKSRNNFTSSVNTISDNIKSSINISDNVESSINTSDNFKSSKNTTSDNTSSHENTTQNILNIENTTKTNSSSKNTFSDDISSSENTITDNISSSEDTTSDNISSSENTTQNDLNIENITKISSNSKNTVKSRINTTQNFENTTKTNSSSKNTISDNISSSKNSTSDNILSSENNTKISEKSRTHSLDEKPKAVKRKVISNSMEESSISSSSAPKRRKCDGVGD